MGVYSICFSVSLPICSSFSPAVLLESLRNKGSVSHRTRDNDLPSEADSSPTVLQVWARSWTCVRQLVRISKATNSPWNFSSPHWNLHLCLINLDPFKAEVPLLHSLITQTVSGATAELIKVRNMGASFPSCPHLSEDFNYFCVIMESTAIGWIRVTFDLHFIQKESWGGFRFFFIIRLLGLKWAAHFSLKTLWRQSGYKHPPDPQEANWKQAWDDAAPSCHHWIYNISLELCDRFNICDFYKSIIRVLIQTEEVAQPKLNLHDHISLYDS